VKSKHQNPARRFRISSVIRFVRNLQHIFDRDDSATHWRKGVGLGNLGLGLRSGCQFWRCVGCFFEVDFYRLSATKTVHRNLSKTDHTRRSRQLRRTFSAVGCHADLAVRYRRHAMRYAKLHFVPHNQTQTTYYTSSLCRPTLSHLTTRPADELLCTGWRETVPLSSAIVLIGCLDYGMPNGKPHRMLQRKCE